MKYTNPGWTKSVAMLFAILAIGGCSETTGPDAIDEALLSDMALVAADATLEDMNLWSQPLAFGPLQAPGALGGHLAPGRPGGREGFAGMFSGTRSATFYDEDGNEQLSYDALTTESIHIEHEIEGEVERDGWTATISRERDKWASGLAGGETHRTWNGTGSEEIGRSRHLDDGTEQLLRVEWRHRVRGRRRADSGVRPPLARLRYDHPVDDGRAEWA